VIRSSGQNSRGIDSSRPLSTIDPDGAEDRDLLALVCVEQPGDGFAGHELCALVCGQPDGARQIALQRGGSADAVI